MTWDAEDSMLQKCTRRQSPSRQRQASSGVGQLSKNLKQAGAGSSQLSLLAFTLLDPCMQRHLIFREVRQQKGP